MDEAKECVHDRHDCKISEGKIVCKGRQPSFKFDSPWNGFFH